MKNLMKYLLLSFLVLLAACESDKDDNNLKVSSGNITLDERTNSAGVTIIADGEWNVRSSDGWCKVSPEKGTGRADIRINGEDNNSMAERKATLTVTSGKSKATITVTQKATLLSLSPQELVFDAEGTAKKVTLTSTGVSWNVSAPAGVTVDPVSGNGNAELTVTLTPNPIRKEREFTIEVNFGSSKEISVVQAEGPNNAPTKPRLNYPAEGATNISVVPEFSWVTSSDADGDELVYTVYYSTDQEVWEKTETLPAVRIKPDVPLETSTTYYWKVLVSDGFGGNTESDVRSFTTSDIAVLPDGSYTLYSGSLPLNGQIPVIFIGDGFTAEDCITGGLFDRKADEGIEAFFSVEPFITYREHFKAYKVYAHSKESGASRWNKATQTYTVKKNTAFSTRYHGDGYSSTVMETDTEKVKKYAKYIPGIDQNVLDNTTIVLIVNDPVYSGTCWMDWSGSSVAIVPTCDNNQPYSYRMTLIHEAGGHGFGRLGDEYFSAGSGTVTAADRESIISWSGEPGANMNIDLTGDQTKVKWKHFLGVSGYSDVGLYEGAHYYERGVWRPESASVMKDMKFIYFNAPSREAIVKRIMKNLNREYAFQQFLDNDVTTKPAALKHTTSAPQRVPAHTPPQLRR